MTPHQRRVRELEASRRLQRDLQHLIDSHSGTIPAESVAEAFERSGSLLPAGSKLLVNLERFAQGLRGRSAGYVGEEQMRRVVAHLRQRSDTKSQVGAGIEARDARLRQKR
jgi:hypothetical protein